MSMCSVAGCGCNILARGMCQKHYARWRRTGSTDPIRPTYDDGRSMLEHATEKFLTGIRKLDSGCWVCKTAQPTGKGYAEIKIGGQKTGIFREKVHRLSHLHFIGPITDGFGVLHTCDFRPCCNPDHLFEGTTDDNLKDMARKGRSCHGAKHGCAKLSEADVLAIYAEESRLDTCVPLTELAKRYNVTISNISYIVTGKSWKRLYKRHFMAMECE